MSEDASNAVRSFTFRLAASAVAVQTPPLQSTFWVGLSERVSEACAGHAMSATTVAVVRIFMAFPPSQPRLPNFNVGLLHFRRSFRAKFSVLTLRKDRAFAKFLTIDQD